MSASKWYVVKAFSDFEGYAVLSESEYSYLVSSIQSTVTVVFETPEFWKAMGEMYRLNSVVEVGDDDSGE